MIKKYLIYRDYKKNLKKAYPTLKKYFFIKNYFNEVYTVLDLSEVPKMKKDEYGIYWKQQEINNFLIIVSKIFNKYNINEELGVLEIKELNDVSYGITFGIKQSIFNTRKFLFRKILSIILIILTTILIIII